MKNYYSKAFFKIIGLCAIMFFNNTIVGQSENTTNPNVLLSVSNSSSTRRAQVFFLASATTGWDNGYDSTTGPASPPSGGGFNLSLYSKLVNDNRTGKLDGNYSIQTLPDESSIVTLGFEGSNGDQVTFSAISYGLTPGVNVYLEDRVNGVFTNLSSTNYTLNLTSDKTGTGQFYLHTINDSTLSTLKNTPRSTKIVIGPNPATDFMSISGLITEEKFKVFNILGAEIDKGVISNNSQLDISRYKDGIYILEIENRSGIRFIKK